MPKAIDLTGQSFGRLTAISPIPSLRNRHRGWLCKCDCGVTIKTTVQLLRKGKVKSCGCLRRAIIADAPGTHSHTRDGKASPTYQCWQNMRARCRNHRHPSYERYGGRGITVCDRWAKFYNFLADMGEKPDGLSIERLDNNGNYTPKNCKWGTIYEQSNNKRSNRRITFKGESKTFTQWAKYLGINKVTLWERLKKHPLARALAPPLSQGRYDSVPKNVKKNAREKVRQAIRAGKLDKKPCEQCGDPDSQAHHYDYYEPLEIQWLCRRCHNTRHY